MEHENLISNRVLAALHWKSETLSKARPGLNLFFGERKLVSRKLLSLAANPEHRTVSQSWPKIFPHSFGAEMSQGALQTGNRGIVRPFAP